MVSVPMKGAGLEGMLDYRGGQIVRLYHVIRSLVWVHYGDCPYMKGAGLEGMLDHRGGQMVRLYP